MRVSSHPAASLPVALAATSVLSTPSQNPPQPSTMIPPMDTKMLAAKIEELLAQLRNGDKTAIDRIVEAYNARSAAPGTVLVQGWQHVIR